VDQQALMALSMVPFLGPVSWRKIAGNLGESEEILGASRQRLIQAGASKKVADSIRAFNDFKSVDQKLKVLESLGARMVPANSPEYPRPLLDLHDSPMVLFVLGEISPADEVALAMVGTRKAGGYGLRIARKLAFQIASSGITVVSGLAEGIDSQSHAGALDAKGRTIAVLGNGLEVSMRGTRGKLAEKIGKNGAVISEFPPGTPGHKGNFPRRNRLIAGLATALCVVEAPARSGASITVRFALEQGKDVLVVPGPIDDPGFEGSHRWLREGAKPALSAMDLIESVLPEAARRMPVEPALVGSPKSLKSPVKLPPEQARVLDAIGSEPVHVDAIAESAGLTIENVLTILTELELGNFVVQLPGKSFRATRGE
jgi:DNA processing protein